MGWVISTATLQLTSNSTASPLRYTTLAPALALVTFIIIFLDFTLTFSSSHLLVFFWFFSPYLLLKRWRGSGRCLRTWSERVKTGAVPQRWKTESRQKTRCCLISFTPVLILIIISVTNLYPHTPHTLFIYLYWWLFLPLSQRRLSDKSDKLDWYWKRAQSSNHLFISFLLLIERVHHF